MGAYETSAQHTAVSPMSDSGDSAAASRMLEARAEEDPQRSADAACAAAPPTASGTDEEEDDDFEAVALGLSSAPAAGGDPSAKPDGPDSPGCEALKDLIGTQPT